MAAYCKREDSKPFLSSSILLFKMFFPNDSFKYLAFEIKESSESFN